MILEEEKPASFTRFSSQPVIGFIEAVPSLSSRHRLLAASSLSTCNSDGHVTFCLLNPTSKSLVLHKGTIIGSFTELNPEDTIINFSSEPQVASMSVHRSMPCTQDSDSSLSSIFQSICCPDLNEKEKLSLRGLLTSFKDIFASSSLDLGHTTIIEHSIDTCNARPIKHAPYRVSQAQQSEIDKQISNVLCQNIIKPSSSPWSSPVVLVKKKDGSTWFCVDYRKLNAGTRKDSYPLPRSDDAIDALSGSTLFTTLDLQSGYYQVAMHPASCWPL